MKNYSLTFTDDLSNASDVICPNFIYNRFDLWEDINVELGKYESKDETFFFEVAYNEKDALIGMYLKKVSKDAVKRITKGVLKRFRIETVTINDSMVKYGVHSEHSHYRIELPNTVEEIEMSLSKKGRYNIRREKRLLEENFGICDVINLSSKDERAARYWDFYFSNKKLTHDVDYKMTASEYIKKYHVTDIYALTVGEELNIGAVILSCEQCPIVYIENLTYDTTMASYSPGSILYDEYLKKLVQKGIRDIYLLGGNYFYKKRYGSICERVFDCKIYGRTTIMLYKLLRGNIIKIYLRTKKTLKK